MNKKERYKLYYERNKEAIKKRSLKYYYVNVDKIRLKRSKEKDLKAEYNKKWRKKNRALNRKQHNAYIKMKMRTDPNYRIAHYIRNRICTLLKKNKFEKSVYMLGCSIEELRKYLESKFKIGMSWDNHGKWHIDHIRPCASFDLTDSEQQKQCFHYTNLQPLWAKDNLSKGSKIV